ncbi:MAG: hypothetical protein FD147_1080 [Chloroflexi bacterium]|nr:MAG: hypothetical protein FD147_1080 [Chloroflexota bacterium]MBA4375149.1 hypothetical protein [Anaerolinea sp.]
MGFLNTLFGSKLYPPESENEVCDLVNELIRIGIKEDFLSEFPGNGYNAQCRHIRTRVIGKRLDEIGGNELMRWVYSRVRKKAGKVPASHLEYAWQEIGHWEP